MSDKVPVAKRYFAQVGSELIELSREHVDLHAEGAAFSTSAPVLHYRVKAVVGDPDTGPSTSYEGIGATWDEAEASLASQLPKEQS